MKICNQKRTENEKNEKKTFFLFSGKNHARNQLQQRKIMAVEQTYIDMWGIEHSHLTIEYRDKTIESIQKFVLTKPHSCKSEYPWTSGAPPNLSLKKAFAYVINDLLSGGHYVNDFNLSLSKKNINDLMDDWVYHSIPKSTLAYHLRNSSSPEIQAWYQTELVQKHIRDENYGLLHDLYRSTFMQQCGDGK